MARPVSTGSGFHRTVYFPLSVIEQMQSAMQTVNESHLNSFIIDAIRNYCETISQTDQIRPEADHGKD